MMKLRILAVAAGLAMLPVIASAQNPTDTTKKDSMAMPMPAPAPAPEPAAAPAPAPAPAPVPAAAKDSSLEPKPVPPSDGTTCPWGCPTSKGAAGLTGPQLLALQQELRDRKCGNNHVTGRLDAATRIAIRNCSRKLGVANNAGALLVAFDVGYSASDVNTSGED
ncbi:MAG: hypothetical protein ABI681_03385 [Gemmatimonadales bacterium]